MFLDDKLYNYTISRQIDAPEDFEALMNELYKITEDHWKPKMNEYMGYADARRELNRVFNAWNLFIKRLEKEEYRFVRFIVKNSYKISFMKNELAKEIFSKNYGK